jgi:hypothetical protein
MEEALVDLGDPSHSILEMHYSGFLRKRRKFESYRGHNLVIEAFFLL